MNRSAIDEIRDAARQLSPGDLAQLMRELLAELQGAYGAQGIALVGGDDLAAALALLEEAGAGVDDFPAPAPWGHLRVRVRLPSDPLSAPPPLTGGTWDPDLPLRREDLYDDRGRA